MAADVWILTDRAYLRQRMPRELFRWLAARANPRLVVADEGGLVSELVPADRMHGAPAWKGLRPGDLVVTRSRHPFALALLEEAEALGARTFDPRSAVLKVRDKASCALALAKRGLPVPPTFLADRLEHLRRLSLGQFPLVVKPVFGDNARGVRVVRAPDELASVAWEDELVLAQRYVDVAGVDLKVYVAGEKVWAIRRPSPLAQDGAEPVAVPVTPAVQSLVQACREEFGLRLFGIDVLEHGDGPVIADVNEFPNYTGIEEAPAVIGGLLLDRMKAAGARRAKSPASSPDRRSAPLRPTRRKVVIIGPGKLGCGFLAPLFTDAGWETVLAARTPEAADRIRTGGSFDVRLTRGRGTRSVPCSAVAFGSDGFEAAIANADLVLTAVGVQNVLDLAPGLAHALARRGRNEPIDVWVVENEDLASTLEQAVRIAAIGAGAVLPPVGFAGAIPYPVISHGRWETDGRPVFVTDAFGGLLVDRSRLLRPLPGLAGVDGTWEYEAHLLEKLLVFGAGHALCAYLGARCGYGRIDQAIRDPLLRVLVRDCLLATRAALLQRHPALGTDVWGPVADVIGRYEDGELEDPIRRVARDPIRKLASSGRLMAAVGLVRETFDRVPASFAMGIASGLLYRDEADVEAHELAVMLRRSGAASVVTDICGLHPGDPFLRAVVGAYERMCDQPPRLALVSGFPTEQVPRPARPNVDVSLLGAQEVVA